MPTAGEPWAVEAVAGVPLNRSAVLCLAFFLSGAAGLVFETLWFRQAGLMLGNSVWASSLVMGAFMAGLATGNTWAVWRGSRVGNHCGVWDVGTGAWWGSKGRDVLDLPLSAACYDCLPVIDLSSTVAKLPFEPPWTALKPLLRL